MDVQNSLITVTSPLLPDLGEYTELLQDIWLRRWLTNNGHYHQALEKAMQDYLGTKHLSLFTNGTLPLMTALQALNLRHGEVITTPYSFVATTHSLWWNGLTPVFVDVDPTTGNIDPARIAEAVTSRTVGIMPVHVYGTPCDTAAIQAIADKHGLKVVYDAAHAFGVTVDGKSILNAGDMSTLSFHATKVYNTVEGGALVCNSAEMKRHIDHLKNFGFTDEVSVCEQGINSKMDEIRSAFGLLNLKQVDAAIARRKEVAQAYNAVIDATPGLRRLHEIPGVRHNYAYYPIFINAEEYGTTRDALYDKFKSANILARRYFYPLIPDFECYSDTLSAKAAAIPVARKLAAEVLCLPMSHVLTNGDVERVLEIVSAPRR